MLTAECYEAISVKFADYILRRALTLDQARSMYVTDYEHACLMQSWTLG